MILKKHIKPTPKFFKLIPWLYKPVAYTLYPFIFLPYDVYKNLKSNNPNPKVIALLIHEESHYERQKQLGALNFAAHYFFSRDFRFNEELTGVKTALKYLKREHVQLNLDNFSFFNPEYLFLWPVSKWYSSEKIKNLFQQLW